jgi:hypothetical protein
VAIKAGQILHAMNQFIVDRIQSGGAGNLNIPQERVYELGDYQSVGIVRDVPDLSFSLDVLDVGTQVEALLTGSADPSADVSGDGTSTDGTLYDLSTATSVDIISPFKSTQGAFNIVKGVAVPQLSLSQAQYRYGLRQNAGEQFTLNGDSIYYVPGVPFLVQYAGDGTTTLFDYQTSTKQNEVESVTITGAPTGGTFTLTFGGQTTAPIAYNASAAAVKSALGALSSIGSGNVAVSGVAGGPYAVTFQGTLGGASQAVMTSDATGLTGGTTPAVNVAETTAGGTTNVALTALPYTELGAQFHALNVSVDGVRQNKDTDYTEDNHAVTFATAPAVGAKIRIVFGANFKADGSTPITVDYTQNVNADLSVKPAAIRGRDIKVYIGGVDATNLWHDVQSVEIDWRVNLEADYEFGNSHAVARDYVDAPDVTGTIELKSITVAALFDKLYQITGVDPSEVIGPQSSVTLPVTVHLLNPDSGGTSAVPRGTVLKTIHVPDARFVIPGYEGRVSQKMTSQLQFTSDRGVLKVVKGAATKSQLGL